MLFSWIGFLFLHNLTLAQDPCVDGDFFELDNVAKRSPSFDMDSTPLCDRYITEGWYRAKSHVMSTSPPALGKCNTLYPVWLKGTTPSKGELQTLTVCEVGFFDNCINTYEIDVKNCSTFLVYKLKPLDVCNSAYCFVFGENCIQEAVHNIRVSFHNITWNETENEKYPGIFQYDPSVNLICSFTPSDDDTLLYHIDWYVDNEAVIQGQNVDKSSIDDAILSAADLNKAGKKINSWVHCVVGAKKSQSQFPCLTQSSNLFFAGIEILNHTLTIERKGNVTLMMRPTIPFVSETIHFPDGKEIAAPLNIQLSFPGNSEAKCKQSSSGSLQKCSVTIDSYTYSDSQKYDDETNWYRIHNIELFNSDVEGYYMPDHKLVLRLETNNANGQGSKIFSNVVFHDVHINVVDKREDWKGKRCSSYADPHQTTFDGYAYECQATGCITGKTYIFYRNEHHLQELQVRHENCWGRPRCVCAVAARSGQDVFTINACNSRQYINFPICNENSLKVIKETDKVYKIVFPTGTFVKVFLYNYGSSNWYINLEVYPTVSDVGRTSGLCGILDNDRTNDLRRRDGTQDNIHSYSYNYPPDDFSLSWQLPDVSTEDLLANSLTVFDSLTPLSSYFYKLCTCDRSNTYCSYKEYTECRANVKGKEYNCALHSSLRRKRDLHFFTHFQRKKAKLGVSNRIKRQSMSEVDAYEICYNAFNQSEHYGTCLQVVPNFTNETLVNCIGDLTMTGDHNLTQLHLDTALVQCQAYILLNSTLENENPEVATIITNLCLNNCSNRGICTLGTCSCNDGFGGSDCSFDVLSPPTITRISGDGVCDKSSETCDVITVYGSYFLENMKTSCYVTRIEINENDTMTSVTSYRVKLEESTLFEGYCGLEYGLERSWITTFQFNLSNDGTQFTNSYTVYIYQSECQIFNNVSGKINFTLQNGFCYINGACVQSGAFKSNASCLQCLPFNDAYNWSLDCNRTETSDSTSLFFLSTSSIEPIYSSSTMIKKPEQSSTGNKVENGSATISISTSSLPTLPSSTDTASKTAVKDNDKNQSTETDLTMVSIGLICSIVVVLIPILIIIGICTKQKFFKRETENKESATENQGDVNNRNSSMT